MTAPDDAKPARKRSSPAKKAPAKRASTGAAPAKKAAPRAAAGTKRTRAGAVAASIAAKRADIGLATDNAITKVLVRQAARVADRLENIDRVLSGDADAWVRVGIPRSDDKRGRIVVEVRVDSLMVEERSQTTVLRGLLAEIHRQRSGMPGGPPPPDEDDDLAVE